MYFPKLTAPAQRRVTVDRFLGLDRRAGSAMAAGTRRWRPVRPEARLRY